MAHAFVNREPGASDRHSHIGRAHARDARLDLGYGTLEPKYHIEFEQSSSYPYLDDDVDLPEEDVIDDKDVDKFLAKTGLGRTRSDFGAKYGTDPFYFVAGNTKLSDCFFRPDNVLKEVETMATALKQKPYMRQSARLSKKGTVGGSDDQTDDHFRSASGGKHGVFRYKPAGSKKGYAGQIPDIMSDTLDDDISNINTFKLTDILDDDLLALKNELY